MVSKTDESAFWELPHDPRDKGMKYPNYTVINSPAGHSIVFDDSSGAESLTLQHATGSSVQFLPDGSSIFRSENKRYQVVFGDDNALITGTVNITINGDTNLKVQGDYNIMVGGNMTLAVEGNYDTIVGGSKHSHIQGSKETTVQGSETTMVAGNWHRTARGRTSIYSQENIKLMSNGGSIYNQAANDIRSLAGKNIASESGLKTDIKSGAQFTLQSKSTATYKSASFSAMDGSRIFFNSGASNNAADA